MIRQFSYDFCGISFAHILDDFILVNYQPLNQLGQSTKLAFIEMESGKLRVFSDGTPALLVGSS